MELREEKDKSKNALVFGNQTAKFILFALFLALCWYFGRFFNIDFEYLRTLLINLPILFAGIIFVVLYVVLTFFIWAGPKDFFRVAGALLFGPYISTIFIWVAEIANACILFHLSRKMGRGFVEEKFKIKKKALDSMQQRSSFLGIIVLRINPLVPFRFMDLGYGLSQIRLRKYVMAIAIGSPIRILWLQVILAGVGMNMFKNPQVVFDYLAQNTRVAAFCFSYFFCVLAIAIVYVIVKSREKKKQA